MGGHDAPEYPEEVSCADKARLIAGLRHDHKLADLLHVAGLPRNTFYYQCQATMRADQQRAEEARIRAVYDEHKGRYGYRVSHETIYNCIYAQPVGELKRELVACMRQAHNKRLPRSKGQDRRGQIPDMLSIHVRPPEVEDRQFPGHWEGDLIKGEANASAVGTLVERTSRLLMLVKLPHPKPASAVSVLQAFTEKLNSIAKPMRKTLTYDQGREMARHKELTANTGIAVYFCDQHSPWQRGSNENINGLVRQYLPKGTDLSGYSQEQLDAIADEINNRPRKGLGVRTPLAVYRQLLLSHTEPQSSLVQ